MDKSLEQLLESRETFQYRPRSTYEMVAFDAGVLAVIEGIDSDLASEYREAVEG